MSFRTITSRVSFRHLSYLSTKLRCLLVEATRELPICLKVRMQYSNYAQRKGQIYLVGKNSLSGDISITSRR